MVIGRLLGFAVAFRRRKCVLACRVHHRRRYVLRSKVNDGSLDLVMVTVLAENGPLRTTTFLVTRATVVPVVAA
jgi:hypothetical protein